MATTPALKARTIMVQGTASSVGKSILTAGLCRLLRRRGLRVAPFKAQNMALNAAVTAAGGEIGRAQFVQAEAAGVVATVDMNPILLKPEGDARSQVVVLGRPIGSMSAVEYHAKKPELRRVVVDALDRLRAAHDVVVIEGAGSPAEINLKDRDLVNMFVAGAADAPVLLVGDIDRGGVFAAFVGTVELLPADERARIAGFLVNKFRGDPALLQPGLDMLTARTGIPVVGVVPYLRNLRIADEDSVSLDHRRRRAGDPATSLDIAVVRLPRISNYDDVQPLEHEPGVSVRFSDTADDLGDADLVILPGSKCTVADLDWLRARGIADAVVERARRGRPVLGICGGYQMLGEVIDDPHGVESPVARVLGLGLLPVTTRFGRDKVTAQVEAAIAAPSLLGTDPGAAVTGYVIHMGRVSPSPASRPGAAAAPFMLRRLGVDTIETAEGALGYGGAVVGTALHGLFGNASVRAALLATLRRRRGLAAAPAAETADDDLDRVADTLAASLDLPRLDAILGLPP